MYNTNVKASRMMIIGASGIKIASNVSHQDLSITFTVKLPTRR